MRAPTSLALAVSLAALILSGCQKPDDRFFTRQPTSGMSDAWNERSLGKRFDDWIPLAPDEKFAGRTLSEWAVEWARWTFSQTSCEDPTYDADGSLCDLYQDPDSPVFFLASGRPHTLRSRCVVPMGKALVVPVSSVGSDNAGLGPDEQQSPDELEQWVMRAMDSMHDLHLRVSGEEVSNLADHMVGPVLFDYTVPPEPNWFSCSGLRPVSGKVTPAYLAGVFALFPPPSPGRRQLEYGGTFEIDNLDVENAVTTILQIE